MRWDWLCKLIFLMGILPTYYIITLIYITIHLFATSYYAFINYYIINLEKHQKYAHMGVSKGEGGVGDRPRMGGGLLVLGEGGPCRIWRSRGFPKLSRKIFPLKPFPTFSHPFFSPRPLLQFLHSSKPFLHLSRSGLFTLSTPSTPFFLPSNPSYPTWPFLSSLSSLLRTPPESPHRVPQKALKGPF